MTKTRVAWVIAAVMLAVLGSIAVAFAQSGFLWHTSGPMMGGVVESKCDGPHKVYLARSSEGGIALFVLQNGCVRTAEAPRAD